MIELMERWILVVLCISLILSAAGLLYLVLWEWPI